MTYNQAYDKIIQAYFKDEIKPNDCKFCFCGTLCDNNDDWHGWTDTTCIHNLHYDVYGYSGTDFAKMENALLITLQMHNGGDRRESNPTYEDALFLGMSASLDVLKQIHIERGEVIDEVPLFTKRQLT